MKIFRMIVIYLLIWIGILVCLAPTMKNMYIESQTKTYNVQNYTAKALLENSEQKVKRYSKGVSITPPSTWEVLKSVGEDYDNQIIGGIAIPRLKMSLPILNALTDENLYAGVAPVVANRKLGEGNYILAGHHIRREQAFFGPLMKVKLGDIIYLRDSKRVYTYVVRSSSVVSEKRVDILRDTKKNQLTLITCDKPSATNKRLIVRADYKKTVTIDSETDAQIQTVFNPHKGSVGFRCFSAILSSLFSVGLILIIILGFIKRGKKD